MYGTNMSYAARPRMHDRIHWSDEFALGHIGNDPPRVSSVPHTVWNILYLGWVYGPHKLDDELVPIPSSAY